MADFHFLHPEWLFAGAGALVLLWTLAALAAWRRRRALSRFSKSWAAADLARSVSPWRRALKLGLLSGGLACLFAAAARPRWGYHLEETERRGVDILFAIDTSRSMLADDLTPDRLTRAKLAVLDLVREFEGDRAGLVAFAGEAFLQVPMTMDRAVFERSLDALDTEVIPRGGTDLAAAIREATAAFGDASEQKLLVLITDGEDLEGDALEAAERAAEAGVRIFAVGVGSPEGARITAPGPDGPTLVRDASGAPVVSRLDEATLREIAAITGGAYEPLGPSGRGLSRLYAEHLSHLPRHAVASRQHRVFHERFQWPLGLGVLLLMLEPLVGERRRFGLRRKRKREPRASGPSRGLAATGAATALLLAAPAFAQDFALPQSLWSSDAASARDADQAYAEGDYARAHELWKQTARGPRHHYNAGAAAYRAGDFDAAVQAYGDALRGADPELQQRAYYDRGNAQFRQGEATLEDDREATKESWRAAIRSYESALALDHADEDARHNLELVRRALEALEEDDQRDREVEHQQQQQRDEQQRSGDDDSEQPQSGDDGSEQPQSGDDGSEQPQSGGDGSEQRGSAGDGSSERDAERGEASERGSDRGEASGQVADADGKQTDGHEERGEHGRGDARRERADGRPEDGRDDGRGDERAPGAEPDDPGPSPAEPGGEPPAEGEAASAGDRDDERDETEGDRPGAVAAAGEPGEEGDAESVAFGGSTGPGEDVGRIDREAAQQLLRSLRHEERRFPLRGRRGERARPADAFTRNW